MKTIRTAGAASIAVAFVLFACLLTVSCSDALLDEMGRLAAEANRPAISPLAGSIITAHETITLSFDSDMTPGSVSVGGSIGLAAPATSWADPRTLNLNLGNVIAWSAGTGKKMTVSISESGQSTVYEYTFEVFNGVCVEGGDPAASDDDSKAWAGTQRHPFSTIAKAIDFIQAIYPTGSEIRVAPASLATTPANEYQIDYRGDAASRIVMADGYSLLGGYSRDWTARNIAGNKTVIRDMSTTGGSMADPNRAVDCGNGLDASTALDGFTILGGGGDASAAVYCSGASPTISNSAINAGTSGSGAVSRHALFVTGGSSPLVNGNIINASGGSASIETCSGIYLYSVTGSPELYRNTVYGGTASSISAGNSFGIVSDSTNCIPTIEGNTIGGGSAYTTYCVYIMSASSPIAIINNLILSGDNSDSLGSNYGLYCSGTAPLVRNNTIRIGDSSGYCDKAYGIFLSGTTSATKVDNNLFICLDGSSSYLKVCIYESQSLSDVASVMNNCFHNFPNDAYHTMYWNQNTTALKTLSTMETALNSESSGTASANLDLDPAVDANFRLTASSPGSLTAGGLDGAAAGWGFSDDRDGLARTGNGATGWSMGCFEKN